MELAVLREKLHEYINIADEQHLSAMYVLLGGDLTHAHTEIYDDATLDMLAQRMENHRLGISKSYSVQESFDIIKQYKKK
jgi:hypothetical protein